MQCQNYDCNLNSFGAVLVVPRCVTVCFDIPIAYKVNALLNFTVIQLVILDKVLVTSLFKSGPV
jgi:hypothetical protein